ncbi:MAG: 2-C-methyl-D-erythritol 2,4-cyclodiphosphate synthase [Solirubrobacterales bacterium]
MSEEHRIGFGYDSHRFAEGRKLVLGGVEFEGEKGLEGHSDADVVTHAVIDALLGATGLGDIGQQFPDTDERYRDANSIELLGQTLWLVAEPGWKICNVDVTVIAESPKIVPHSEEMRHRIAAAVGIRDAHINIKGTTNEGMGLVGRGEGIAAMAVVLIER